MGERFSGDDPARECDRCAGDLYAEDDPCKLDQSTILIATTHPQEHIFGEVVFGLDIPITGHEFEDAVSEFHLACAKLT